MEDLSKELEEQLDAFIIASNLAHDRGWELFVFESHVSGEKKRFSLDNKKYGDVIAIFEYENHIIVGFAEQDFDTVVEKDNELFNRFYFYHDGPWDDTPIGERQVKFCLKTVKEMAELLEILDSIIL